MKPRKRVLIVDDKKYFRIVMGDILTFAGFATELAEDGASALGLLNEKNFEFDLAIIDIHIPSTTCFELITKIRERKNKTALPIIVVTAMFKRKEDIENLKKMGVNNYIYKCVPLEDFLYIIDQLVFPKNKDLRAHERILVSFPVKFQLNKTWTPGCAFNLTPKGMFIKTKKPVKLGTPINLTFKLPEFGNEIKVKAQVRHRYESQLKPEMLNRTGIGVSFENVTRDQQRILVSYLTQVRRRSFSL